MKDADVLRDLFDEKIIGVIGVFLNNPEKHFSLSEISSVSRVHIATTFRIINKLMDKDFIRLVLVGKSKFYQLKRGDKASTLFKFLKSEGDYISEFIQNIKDVHRIKKVILENKTDKDAKILIVGNFIPADKIKQAINDIKLKHNFNINFVEISEKQYEEMEKLGLYDLERKIIWERKD